MKTSGGWLIAILLACALSACGGDKKDSAEREQEVQKVLQEGMQKEKAMYEGMQKSVEDLQKKVESQSGDAKK
jgi:uncharacterized protein YlxW (UPF0749 family)